MSKMISLIKVFLKTTGEEEISIGKKKIPPMLFMALMVIIMVFALGFPFAMMISELYDTASQIGQEGVIIGLLVSMASVMTFIFGIVYAMATLYFSRDIEYLLPLPLKPFEILGAKFSTVLVYEYITELMILLLPLGVYGVKSNAPVMYWIVMIVVLLLLPVLPLVLACIINMIVMTFTNLGKHKDLLKTIGAIVAIGMGLGFSMLMQKMESMMVTEADVIEKIVSGNNSMVSIVTAIFPTSKFAAEAMVAKDPLNILGNLAVFLTITGAAIAIFFFIGNKIYFKGALGASETFSKREKLSEEQLSKSTNSTSPMKAYILKEIRMLVRTPIYFLNCVIMNFIWPLFFIIPLITQPDIFGLIGESTNIIFNSEIQGIIIGMIVSVMIFICNTNMIACTAISREGKNLFFTKYIPMSYSQQLIAKASVGMIFDLINIVFLIVLGIVMKAPISFVILAVILSLMVIIASNLLGIMLDLKKPKLNWDNEAAAVKQNFTSMIAMFGAMIIAVLNGILVFNLSWSFMQMFILEFVILALLIIFSLKYIMTKGEIVYQNLS
ncbi:MULTISPECIES: putative ABC transporter permease subunit [Clostridium]|uniref:ABC-2 type transport system permease protein n=1 Tax=Clostridium cadaveris TaxID=1529 RepID=A0A316M864_9CLOT|nr:hypothetical protein [Clostridium cadaveris]MDU4952058.1 hypothetical protein [Clostridium sp.]NME63027.1 hypothetical protein [Clostridium cadaveris]PWL54231.1 MAG: hypothetical protein DBY38_04930 [Clostridium cadaveris]UFH64786.1 hypothetical protein KQH81_16270 [Clostridium cadaveris]